MTDNEKRPGEIRLPFNPATSADDDSVVFIGRIRTPWKTRADCPRNMVRARERDPLVTIELDDAFCSGLKGLEKYSHAILIYWMHEARRDRIVQHPRHVDGHRGVFALRSPVRPNPIALATVRIIDVDQPAGRITIDAIDCLDGTPLLDIKPWLETIDGIAPDKGLGGKQSVGLGAEDLVIMSNCRCWSEKHFFGFEQRCCQKGQF